MKVESAALALRLGAAWFLFALTVAALYLEGAAQSYSEDTLSALFQGLRWLAWGGFLFSWLGLLPWSGRRKRRILASVVLGVCFGLLVIFVLIWGAWIYPGARGFPW